jgi:hypothetical protein
MRITLARRRSCVGLLTAAAFASLAAPARLPAQGAEAGSLPGYGTAMAAVERAIEGAAIAIPSAGTARVSCRAR